MNTLLWIPPTLGAISLLRISYGATSECYRRSKDSDVYHFLDITSTKADGRTLFLLKLSTLLDTLVLFSLQIYSSRVQEVSLVEIFLLVFYTYTFILSVFGLICRPAWKDECTIHLNLLLFTDFCVYFIRDAWPYAVVGGLPYDRPADAIMWLRFGILSICGFLIPLVSPQPFRPTTPDAEPGNEETASLLSRLSYAYVDKIVFHAYKKPDLSLDDIPKPSSRKTAANYSREKFPKLDPFVLPRKRHFLWRLLNAFRLQYISLFSWLIINTVTDFAGPFGMMNLLLYVESGEKPFGVKPWIWIVLMTLGPIINSVVLTQYLSAGFKIAVECESVFTQLVFEHALRIRLKGEPSDQEDAGQASSVTKNSPKNPSADQAGSEKKAKGSQMVGKISNLITSDVSSLNSSWQSAKIPAATIQAIISVVFLYKLLGWSAFVGIGAAGTVLPLTTLTGKWALRAQKKRMEKTDERVQSVTETLGVIRMIKLFAWEPLVTKKLNEKRENELKYIWRGKTSNMFLAATNEAIPIVTKVTSFAIFALVMKGELTASRIFTSLTIFNVLENNIFSVTTNLPMLMKLKVSLDRFTEYFNQSQYLDSFKADKRAAEVDRSALFISGTNLPTDRQDVVGFHSCRFSWDPIGKIATDADSTTETRSQFILDIDGEVFFEKNRLNIIVGPTASGKTSLLMALLGEMYAEPKDSSSWFNLPRSDGVAYVVQESWVLNKTIKDNIVFGEDYDQVRYKKVIRNCALEKDISMWQAGDETEVGEKGLTLSGGQKARITLARALYSRASILLLDDVLAALDVHTAKWIVKEALTGDLVEGRTVLLVTHNVPLVAPMAHKVILMGKNGKVAAQGSIQDVLKYDDNLKSQVEEKKENDFVAEEVEKEVEEEVQAKQGKQSGKLVVAEEKAIGRVEFAALKLFLNAFGGPFIWWATVIIPHCIGVLVTISERRFMGYWSSQYEYEAPDRVPVVKYIFITMGLNITQLLVDLFCRMWLVRRSLRASRMIYSQLTESVFSATFRWLDVTPIGRIIVRCTQDINTIDGPFSGYLGPLIHISVNIILLFITAVIMAGWVAVIPGLTVAAISVYIGNVYVKAQLIVQREMSNAKAPIMNEVQAALASLPSIRAYGAQSQFRDNIQKGLDNFIRCALTFYDINRWITVRADTLGALFAGTISTYLLYWSGFSAGTIGFTLNTVILLSELIMYWVRIYNELEVNANSLERVLSYLRIEHEPTDNGARQPPAFWPASGHLRVEHLSARYSDDSPDVLHDISFEVKSGERIGVVGRTGAGKSSIALALLRAIKTDGEVYYDGLDTSDISFKTLRSKITLIPQQPELMNGTLRENLDPLGEYDDAALHDALQAAGLYKTNDVQERATMSRGPGVVNESPDEGQATTKIGLDTHVEAGGTNFSLGQRQIIALARAMIRRSKLLILDEATAAIDYETDAAIQKALRTEFSKDTTFIIIAHRLQTIMDSDKILVLDHGKIVEFDSPKVLAHKKEGYLRALLDESEDRETLLAAIG